MIQAALSRHFPVPFHPSPNSSPREVYLALGRDSQEWRYTTAGTRCFQLVFIIERFITGCGKTATSLESDGKSFELWRDEQISCSL